MATVQVSVLNGTVTSATTVNDGGTVVNGGNIGSDNPMTNNRSLNEVADGGEEYGSVVVKTNNPAANDYQGVIEAKGLGTGTFAFYPNAQQGERNFLIRGAGTEDGNNEINNVASSVLTSPASEVGLRTVSPETLIVSTRQLGEDDAEFNVLARPSTDMVPGRTKGTNNGASSTFVNPEDQSPAVASEILASRAVPGELTFMFGGANPTNTNDGNSQDYKARDSYES
jgi:hypothetical protein